MPDHTYRVVPLCDERGQEAEEAGEGGLRVMNYEL
jgi:hypothetical protein